MFPLFLVIFGVGDTTKIWSPPSARARDPLQRRLRRDERAQDPASGRAGDGRLALAGVQGRDAAESPAADLRRPAHGVSLALVIVIVAEMFIGSVDGLGHRIYRRAAALDHEGHVRRDLRRRRAGLRANILFLADRKAFVHWSGK